MKKRLADDSLPSTPYTMYRYGFGAWARMLKSDGWKYVLLAAIDVEVSLTSEYSSYSPDS